MGCGFDLCLFVGLLFSVVCIWLFWSLSFYCFWCFWLVGMLLGYYVNFGVFVGLSVVAACGFDLFDYLITRLIVMFVCRV